MNSRGRKPGEYPSAGPLAHLIDVWHYAAPNIDFLAPDLYDKGFVDWVAKYKLHNNPLSLYLKFGWKRMMEYVLSMCLVSMMRLASVLSLLKAVRIEQMPLWYRAILN